MSSRVAFRSWTSTRGGQEVPAGRRVRPGRDPRRARSCPTRFPVPDLRLTSPSASLYLSNMRFDSRPTTTSGHHRSVAGPPLLVAQRRGSSTSSGRRADRGSTRSRSIASPRPGRGRIIVIGSVSWCIGRLTPSTSHGPSSSLPTRAWELAVGGLIAVMALQVWWPSRTSAGELHRRGPGFVVISGIALRRCHAFPGLPRRSPSRVQRSYLGGLPSGRCHLPRAYSLSHHSVHRQDLVLGVPLALADPPARPRDARADDDDPRSPSSRSPLPRRPSAGSKSHCATAASSGYGPVATCSRQPGSVWRSSSRPSRCPRSRPESRRPRLTRERLQQPRAIPALDRVLAARSRI